MVQAKKHRVKKGRSLADTIPGTLDSALVHQDDFILTHETDPDTGIQSIHMMTGKFISACMLRKLEGLAESQRDEGSTFVTWTGHRERVVKRK